MITVQQRLTPIRKIRTWMGSVMSVIIVWIILIPIRWILTRMVLVMLVITALMWPIRGRKMPMETGLVMLVSWEIKMGMESPMQLITVLIRRTQISLIKIVMG